MLIAIMRDPEASDGAPLDASPRANKLINAATRCSSVISILIWVVGDVVDARVDGLDLLAIGAIQQAVGGREFRLVPLGVAHQIDKDRQGVGGMALCEGPYVRGYMVRGFSLAAASFSVQRHALTYKALFGSTLDAILVTVVPMSKERKRSAALLPVSPAVLAARHQCAEMAV
jgi:hypothetical protein